MEINELLLKTIFCCMACDGDIAPEEISLVKEFAESNPALKVLNIQEILNGYVKEINEKGKAFLFAYLNEVSKTEIPEDYQLQMVKAAISMIEADNKVEYSEVSFFKEIRLRLSISDEAILSELPDKEDYLLPDIKRDDIFDALTFSFSDINFASPISEQN